MAKNVVQDVVIHKNVPMKKPSQKETESVPPRRPLPPKPPRRRRSFGTGGFSKKWLWVLLAVVVVAFIGLSFTGGVVIEVTPKTERQNINLSFSLDDLQEQSSLPVVEVVTAKGSMEKEVPAQGLKDIEKKATGKIVIFNDYSESPQRLIARTRFESSNGLIFRIADAVSVPGKDDDGPGSLEVTVQADEPGEEYNISFTDFTIPGLKGTPLFDGIYARSKTEMTGGFSGLTKEVKKEDADAARDELKNSLTGTLKEQAREDVPSEYVLLNDAIFLSFSEDKKEDIENEEEPVTFVLNGTLEGLAIQRKALNSYIKDNALPNIEADSVRVANLEDLSFTIKNKDEINIESPENVEITLSGEALFVWNIDKMAVQSALSGLSKDEVTYQRMFIEEFPDIIQAKVTSFTPFWARKFPGDPDKIEVVEVLK